ncbi:polysaccharide pyruvyl transferase CsaB [Rubeoparvulum massiliense]|uniref:polysaccharide pyruvyl transferase CsaB n=1 Tax=Rubeoparvulum massiliense TaxID=1631346 RepID=UPI00065E4AC8|nr:polysaccharide pyruvyl transferase CsaB [Rubeoparvulum massiliense]
MFRIVIAGYYGFNNVGDDALLYAITSSLIEEVPALQFAVLSNNPKETEALFHLPAYNRWSIKEIVGQLRHSDLLLMGGGSLLQDVSSPRSTLYYLAIIQIAKWLGKPVVLYAQGFGPVSHQANKWLIRRIVNQVDLITVRDAESKDDFLQHGVTKTPIHVAADPAFLLHVQSDDLEAGTEVFTRYGCLNGRPTLGISVRDWKDEHAFKEVLAHAADEVVRMGWNVVFLPMHYPHDLQASQDIVNLMKEPAFCIDEKLNYRQMIGCIAQLDMMVGMRLHAAILAAAQSIPFITLSYDPKVDRFVESMGMPNAGRVETLQLEPFLPLLLNTIEHREDWRNHLLEQLRTFREKAALSNEKVLQLLEEKKTSLNTRT